MHPEPAPISSEWREALRETIESRPAWGLSYGEDDCCQFVRRYYEALTGVDPAAHWVYEDMIEAAHLIRDHGGISGVIEAVIGPPSGERIERGAIVVVEGPEGIQSAAVWVGDYSIGVIPADGVCRLMNDWKVTWWWNANSDR